MSKLQVGFVGLGRAAAHYAEIINKFYKDKIEISVGIDSFKDARDNWSEKYGCETKSNISDIDPSKVNFVIVITPSGSHAEDSKQLLQKGINVLCEKPIGLNIEEVQENIEIADKADLSYGGVFQNRMNKPILYIKKIFENEDFGNIISAGVKLQWCRFQEYYNDEWHGRWKTDGGVINQQAIHHIDALFHLFGPPKCLSGFSGNINNKLEAEDTFVASGVFQQGGFFTIEATTAVRPDDYAASLEIITDKYQISIGGIALNKLERFRKNGKDINEVLSDNSEEVINGYGNGHKYMLAQILNNWEQSNRIIFPLSAADSLNSLRYIHALYSSVENNSVISFSDDVRSVKLGQDV